MHVYVSEFLPLLFTESGQQMTCFGLTIVYVH